MSKFPQRKTSANRFGYYAAATMLWLFLLPFAALAGVVAATPVGLTVVLCAALGLSVIVSLGREARCSDNIAGGIAYLLVGAALGNQIIERLVVSWHIDLGGAMALGLPMLASQIAFWIAAYKLSLKRTGSA